jgi:hypothetical protein
MSKNEALRYLSTVGCAEVHNKAANRFEYWFTRKGDWCQSNKFVGDILTTDQLADHMVEVEG